MKKEEKNRKNNEIVKAFALLSQIGIMMVTTIGLCFFIGLFIDKKLNTEPIFLIIFIILGCLSGLRNMYVIVKRTWKD